MALKDRIIGGGFLVFGVAIVLILIFVLEWGGIGPKEAFDQIRDEIFPAYLAAEKEDDYLAMQKEAGRLVDVMDAGGAIGVRDYARGDAIPGRSDAKRLHQLLQQGAFRKNREGLFGFEDGWYRGSTHRGLRAVNEAVEERLKTLRDLRTLARNARQALADARTGSGLPLELPAPVEIEPEDVPVAEPNPVYQNDAEAFRVFGLAGADLEKALSTPNPGGRATSARLRWNQTVVPGGLSRALDGVPELAASLGPLATEIKVNAAEVAEDETAEEALAELLQEAVILLGTGLEEPYRGQLKEQRDVFATGGNIAKVLQYEARLLETYAVNLRGLAAAFAKPFATKN
jgi:hypothetical protein